MDRRARRSSQVLAVVLDDIGIGFYHYMQCCFLATLVFVDGCEVLLCSSILQSLSVSWGLTPMSQAALVSAVFAGGLLGSFLGGHCADIVGRRLVVLAAYSGIIASAIAASFCTGFNGMIVCRFLLGLCFGGGVPPMLTLFAESAPRVGGDQLMNLGCAGWACGEIYAAFVLKCYMPSLVDTTDSAWRWVLRASVLPNVFAIFPMCWCLQESPLFLFVNGRAREASEVVEYIAAMNGQTDAVADRARSAEQPGAPAGASEAAPLVAKPSRGHWSMLMERDVCVNVCIGTLFYFAADFHYFGLGYALPQVILALNAEMGAANELLVAAAASIPGYVLAAALSLIDSHRYRLLLVFLASASLEVAMGGVDFHDMSVEQAKFGVAIASSLKATSSAAISLVAVFCSKAFPTACRTNGVAVCLTGGRLACILAPFVHEASLKRFGGLGADFMICAVVCSCAALVAVFMINDATVERQPEEAGGSLPRRLTQRLSIPHVIAANAARDTALAGLHDGSQA